PQCYTLSLHDALPILKKVHKELEKRQKEALVGGGEKRIASQHAKKKLTARERIEYLLDEGSFEEQGMLVTHRTTDFGMDKQIIQDRKSTRLNSSHVST